MGINMLPTSPSEWSVAETLYMTALTEIWNDIRNKRGKRGVHGGPPPNLTPFEQEAWDRAASKPYYLLDLQGKPVKNTSGDPVRFVPGDKTIAVDVVDFWTDWQRFCDAESDSMYRERLAKLLDETDPRKNPALPQSGFVPVAGVRP